jgi:hypothetical protein
MRLIYKFEADGVWFSKNGESAYKRGEKPEFLWPDNATLEETCVHHIARKRGRDYSRELVMFYRVRKNNLTTKTGG